MSSRGEQLKEILDQASRLRILVVGDAILDEYIWGTVEKISPEAPVQVVDWKARDVRLGGAANVAHNLAVVGCRVYLGGVVGADWRGETLRQLAVDAGIDTTALIVDPQRPTTHKLRIIAQNQQVLRIDREVRQEISGEVEERLCACLRHILQQTDGVIFSDYLKGVVSQGLMSFVTQLAKVRNHWVIVDPKGQEYGRYKGVQVITPNRREAEAACGFPFSSEEEIEKGGTYLLRLLDCEAVLITRGKEGLFLCLKNGVNQNLPAQAREVYDVTGAGDTVVSFFALSAFAGADLVSAAHLANLAAGIVVGKVGTAVPSKEELLENLRGGTFSSAHKIVSRTEARRIVDDAKKRGKKVVFTNGCFDLLHVGHIKYLEQAKGFGDVLLVGLNDDGSVRALKGPQRPIIGQEERAKILAALSCVDYVILFSDLTPERLIAELKPDVLVKGADYSLDQVAGREIVESYGGMVKLIPPVEGKSTSGLVRTVLERYNAPKEIED